MIEIQKPNINREDLEVGRKTRYAIEPLERGFGTTLGNSLRRILLGALPGAAPRRYHEFTAYSTSLPLFPVSKKTLPILFSISKVLQ